MDHWPGVECPTCGRLHRGEQCDVAEADEREDN